MMILPKLKRHMMKNIFMIAISNIQEKNNIISKKLTDFNQLINDLSDIRFKGVSLALSLLFTKYDF